jgi:hypothetical protein
LLEYTTFVTPKRVIAVAVAIPCDTPMVLLPAKSPLRRLLYSNMAGRIITLILLGALGITG